MIVMRTTSEVIRSDRIGMTSKYDNNDSGIIAIIISTILICDIYLYVHNSRSVHIYT